MQIFCSFKFHYIFTHLFKHMFWVLKITVSMMYVLTVGNKKNRFQLHTRILRYHKSSFSVLPTVYAKGYLVNQYEFYRD